MTEIQVTVFWVVTV